ncbi:MAG: glycoside hydrolase family 3 protein, partial [Oscillospiraceae bacterium]|nr:glycoside hydrolase family 3 protein [Oscillospiraceae bacterium]
VWEIMEQMTVREKIYQLFVVTPEQLTDSNLATAAGEKTKNAIHARPVGGIIYFADNLVNASQVSSMLSNSQQYARESGIGLFLAVDEEGGLVARCAKKLGTTKLSPMATYGVRNDFNEAFSIGQTLGNDISQFGFNLDFAPVADVNLNSGNELGNRIFSDNPDVTANMVSGVVQGLQSTGVAATLKHFPGLGAENGNAHYDDAVHIDRSLDQLRNEEFIPFRSGIAAGSDFVMVSHQIVSGVGDGLPSCLSYTVCTELLREELGFDGIIITDSFQMNTISGSYSPADSAILAIDAGIDIILMPSDLQASVDALENAVNSGRISESRIDQSVERILLEKEKLNLLG